MVAGRLDALELESDMRAQLLIGACICSSSDWCPWHRLGYVRSIVEMCTLIGKMREPSDDENINRVRSVGIGDA